MRQKVLFCFFILTFAAVSAGAIETLTLDNGLTVSLDNQLPKSIRGYYTVSGLLSELNNPGRATGIQNFPFSFGLVLKYDDSIGS